MDRGRGCQDHLRDPIQHGVLGGQLGSHDTILPADGGSVSSYLVMACVYGAVPLVFEVLGGSIC